MFTGLDITKGYHVFYLMLMILTPFVAIVCIVTIWGPGWLLGALWWWVMAEAMPIEMQEAKKPKAPGYEKTSRSERTRLW